MLFSLIEGTCPQNGDVHRSPPGAHKRRSIALVGMLFSSADSLLQASFAQYNLCELLIAHTYPVPFSAYSLPSASLLLRTIGSDQPSSTCLRTALTWRWIGCPSPQRLVSIGAHGSSLWMSSPMNQIPNAGPDVKEIPMPMTHFGRHDTLGIWLITICTSSRSKRKPRIGGFDYLRAG